MQTEFNFHTPTLLENHLLCYELLNIVYNLSTNSGELEWYR